MCLVLKLFFNFEDLSYLFVVATDLLDLAGEGLYPALSDAILVEGHLQLPLDLVVVGLDLGELKHIHDNNKEFAICKHFSDANIISHNLF